MQNGRGFSDVSSVRELASYGYQACGLVEYTVRIDLVAGLGRDLFKTSEKRRVDREEVLGLAKPRSKNGSVGTPHPSSLKHHPTS